MVYYNKGFQIIFQMILLSHTVHLSLSYSLAHKHEIMTDELIYANIHQNVNYIF